MRVGCGVDLIETSRIEKAINTNERFRADVFTGAEITYCEAKNAGRHESYAARFAAKEAFLKALGIGLFAGASLKEIEIVNDKMIGAPQINMTGGAAEIYNQKGGVSISVSLSHSGGFAIATVVVLFD